MVNAAHRFDNSKRRRAGDHDRQRMLTPAYVLEPIRALLGGIDVDPCTEPDNPTGARTFYALPQDGLALTWTGRSVFCNPPYGEARWAWVERCIASGNHRPTVLLMPAHTDTQTAQTALRACSSVCFVQARIRFAAVRQNGRHEAASHPSMILGFGVDVAPLATLGTVFGPSSAARKTLGKVVSNLPPTSPR
jgi:hypothetical protein